MEREKDRKYTLLKIAAVSFALFSVTILSISISQYYTIVHKEEEINNLNNTIAQNIETINNLTYLCSEKHVFELQENVTELRDTIIDLRGTNELLLQDKRKLENENEDLVEQLKLFMVEVYGKVTTIGENTQPLTITFEKKEVKHIVRVSEKGLYSIRLENNKIYKVIIHWKTTIFPYDEHDSEIGEPFQLESYEERLRKDWEV